ncbi:MAG: hypothetical protein MUO42_06585 [Anaerolineaceae bacterium]|nr:hypothetical protein [Anaerolineaceae bacterium]
MKHNFSIYKRISMVLGITTLLLGLIPLSVLGGVGLVSADDGGVVEPAPTEEPAAPPVEELVSDPPAPEAEPLAEEVPTLEVSDESLSVASSTIGDDPNVAGELPDFGNNYNNGDCVTNDACVTAEPVTNPNEYTDHGTYGEKDYVLPDIGGNTANIVALKKGDTWYFFKKGSGETCVEDTFCVNFDDEGNVSVFSYQTQANGYKGYNMIHFWFVAPPGDNDILGCTDRSAKNFNPEANVDDGSCKFKDDKPDPVDVPDGVGGPVAPLLIPVTGLDLNTPLAGLQTLFMVMGLMFFGVTLMLEGFERKLAK